MSELPNGPGRLVIRVKDGVSATQVEPGVVVFREEEAILQISTSNNNVLGAVLALTSGTVNDTPPSLVGRREILLFRLIERELSSSGVLEYITLYERTPLWATANRTATRRTAKFEPSSTRTWRLATSAVILPMSDGRFQVENSIEGTGIILWPKGLVALASLLPPGPLDSTCVLDLAELLIALKILEETTENRVSYAKAGLAPIEQVFHHLSRPITLDSKSQVRQVNEVPRVADPQVANNRRARNSSLLEAIRTRRTRRKTSTTQRLVLDDLVEFIAFLLERNESENGVSYRSFPAAGGFYQFEFFVLVHACDGLGPGMYQAQLKHPAGSLAFRNLERPASDTESALSEIASACGMTDQVPDVVIFVGIENTSASKKYGLRAYRLALLNGGVLLHVMYMLAEALNLSGCAIGLGSKVLEHVIQDACPQHVMLVEFALCGTTVEDPKARTLTVG